MGQGATRVFGLKFGSDNFGLIDALIKFADVLQVYSKYGEKGEIPMYDKDGKKTGSVLISNVAANVATAISSFAQGLADNMPVIEEQSITTAQKLAAVLLGEKTQFWRADKPGLLDAIMKFADLIKNVGSDGKTINYTDDKGKLVPVDTAKTARNIVSAIASFITTLNATLGGSEMTVANKNVGKSLNSFDKLNDQLVKLIKTQTGLEKTSKTLGTLAISIGDLSKALDKLDADKLKNITSISENELQAKVDGNDSWISKTVNKIFGATPGGTVPQTAGAPKEENVVTTNAKGGVSTLSDADMQKLAKMISEQIVSSQPDWNMISMNMAKQLSMAMNNKHFNFEFGSDKSGILQIQ